jgi:hypothetical protein
MSNCCIKEHDYKLENETISIPLVPPPTTTNKAWNATKSVYLLGCSEHSDLQDYIDQSYPGGWFNGTFMMTISKRPYEINGALQYCWLKNAHYLLTAHPNQSEYGTGRVHYWWDLNHNQYFDGQIANYNTTYIDTKSNSFASYLNPITNVNFNTKEEMMAHMSAYIYAKANDCFSNYDWKPEWKPIYNLNLLSWPTLWYTPATYSNMPNERKSIAGFAHLSYVWDKYIEKNYFNNDIEQYKHYLYTGFYRTLTPNFSTPTRQHGWGSYPSDEINQRQIIQNWWSSRPFELAHHRWLECPFWDPGSPEIPYRAAIPEVPYQPAVAEQLYVPGVPEQPYVAAVPEQPYVPAVPEQPYMPEQVIDCFALKVISTPPIMLAPPRDNVEITLAPTSCVAKSLLYPWKDTIMITIKCHQNTTLRLTGVTNREYKIFDKTPFSQFQTFNPGAKHNHVHQKRLDLKKNQLLAARKLTLSRL